MYPLFSHSLRSSVILAHILTIPEETSQRACTFYSLLVYLKPGRTRIAIIIICRVQTERYANMSTPTIPPYNNILFYFLKAVVAIIDVLFFHSLGRAPLEWLFFFTPLRSFTFDILIALWLN